MAEPCQQEGRVSSLEATVEGVAETLVEIKELLRETRSALQVQGRQGAEISAMRERIGKAEKDVNELFGRTRKVEEAIIAFKEFVKHHDEDGKKADEWWRGLLAPTASAIMVAVVMHFWK